MRDCEVRTFENITDLGPSWQEVISESGRTFIRITACEFGLAEEVIGLIVTYQDGVGYMFEVGIGEVMRPYDKLYEGDSRREAERMFWETVTKLVMEREEGSSTTWKIWGDQADPLFENESKEVVLKEYAEKYADNTTTYIEDPDGNEYAWQDGRLKEVN